MRITEKRLRRVIQQVIRESMHDEMSEVAPMASVADAIRAFAASASNDDMLQLHRHAYIDSNCCKGITSALIKVAKESLRNFDHVQIERACVFPVLFVHIKKAHTDINDVDLSYDLFRKYLQTNADSIAQKMMTKCQKM